MRTGKLSRIAGVILVLGTFLLTSGAGGGAPKRKTYSAPPPMKIVAGKKYTATIETSRGDLVLELFPNDEILNRWITLARDRVPQQGLPARICWLGQGDRATFGLALNDLVASGELQAPIVIGRDHLDTGSVASPYRETEAMKDGSDAVADWPLLNALLNTASGATWVSIHNGGGAN